MHDDDITALDNEHIKPAIVKTDRKNQTTRLKDIKKGIPLYPNLVNLTSNTMKNTVQK